jgi:hypothetical protein
MLPSSFHFDEASRFDATGRVHRRLVSLFTPALVWSAYVSFGATSEAKENYFAGATRNSTGLNLISIASPSAFAGTNQ